MSDLIREGELLARGVERYRGSAQRYYFALLFSKYRCPRCGSVLRVAGPSIAICSCGLSLDPTIVFQMSPCCQSGLVRRVLHYACGCCGRAVPSLFLFHERVYDREYFREMMAKSRNRKRQERLLFRAIARHRSGDLLLLESPHFDTLDRFEGDLNELVGQPLMTGGTMLLGFDREFDPSAYWHHIWKQLAGGGVRFSAIAPLDADVRRDRAWRFVTLVFMEQEREVFLTQRGGDILVERYEADREG